MSSAINLSTVGNIAGFQGTDWAQFTMTVTGTSSNPSKGTIVTDAAYWRRVGSCMEIVYTFEQSSGGTAGSGTYLYSLPSGYSINTSLVKVTTSAQGLNGTRLGSGCMGNTTSNSSNFYEALDVYAYDSTRLRLTIHNNALNQAFDVSNTTFSYTNTPLYITFRAVVPISGWSVAGSPLSIKSYVLVQGYGGYGSSSTATLRFTSTNASAGSDITYADSATLGGKFTINTAGLYEIYLHAKSVSGGDGIGFAVNDTVPTVPPNNASANYGNGLRGVTVATGTGIIAAVTRSLYLLANDVITFKSDGGALTNDQFTMASVTRIG